ncbi:TetR family transcriptional regulator [Glutamicibacter sp. X7]
MSSRRERTHQRLLEYALDLFEERGFEQTTVSDIATAAGVTEMTFFRHFSSKDQVVLADPYDPVIAQMIATQPENAPALLRATAGIRSALGQMPDAETKMLRRRIQIIAGSTSLRASTHASNIATEVRIADQLHADGAPALIARVAAAAVMSALTAALFEWAEAEGLALPEALDVALDVLEGNDG